MRRIFKKFLAVLVLVSSLPLLGCGGGSGSDEASWDAFQPRTATPGDLVNRSFVFTDFEYGAVFDPSLNKTSTTLAFGSLSSASGAVPATMSFTLGTSVGRATGTASLSADVLTLSFGAVDAGLPFATGGSLNFKLLADVDGGRISLTNQATGKEATSKK